MSDREFVVLKFGGTSVATRARWDRIAQILQTRLDEGRHPFVCCSAVSGVSNALESVLEKAGGRGATSGTRQADDWESDLEAIEQRHRQLADELEVDFDLQVKDWFDGLRRLLQGASLIQEVSPRLRARVMSTGELISTRLGTAYLRRHGFSVDWLDARQWLTSRPQGTANQQRQYLSATCEYDRDEALVDEIRDNSDATVHLTQGFIARNPDGETVLLGRGGSDTSAAYFASKVGAERLEIWTDVPGMFTANPSQVPQTRLLKELGYAEAQELATMGAEVLHPRCIDPVREQAIPLHVRCVQDPDIQGTRISDDTPNLGPQVKAISAKTGVTLVSMETLGMWQEVGFLADAFDCFRRNGLSIDLVATSETNVTVSLDPNANALDDETIRSLLEDLNDICNAEEIGGGAVVSLVGRHIRSILHELGPALEVFEEQQVHLVSQAASDLNFTFVVDEEHADRLVTKLHALLFAERGADRLLGPTWEELMEAESGADAGEGENEPSMPEVWWVAKRDALLDVADDRGPVYVYDAERLDKSVDDVQGLQGVDRTFYAIKANPNPDILRRFYNAGMGFECVSPGEVAHIRELFPDIAPSRILFTPNFAPRDEYLHGFDEGVHVTVDNLHPLREWPEVFAGQEVLVRLDPGRGRGHHEYVKTAGPRSKFGVAPEELEELHDLAGDNDVRIVGLHAHLGSGIKTPETWAETGLFLAEAAEEFPEVEILNLGGGLGVADAPGKPPLDLEAVDEKLLEFRGAHPAFEIWLEPGRFMVSDAGVLLARVTQTKKKGEVSYVGVETGLNSLIRPALYGAYHEIVNLTNLGEPTAMSAEVVGPICETGDVLGHGRRLPATGEGDVLLIAQTGAYGRAMSSHYNLREPAGEFVLD